VAPLLTLDIGDARWAGLIERDPAATLFHHPAWVATLAESYGYRPLVLAAERADGELDAALSIMEVRRLHRVRWIALPFTDHCPPLGPGVDAGFAASLDAARRSAGASALEVHAELPGPHARSRTDAVRHVLPLAADPDEVMRTFRTSQVKRNIKKAAKAGVTVRRGDCAADLADVYYRLHVATRQRLGVPVQPRRFFERLWDQVMAPGLGFTLIAEADGAPVAGAVYLTWNRTVIYKFGASDASAWGLRPNHAIFWEAIRWSCEAGYADFDFGRSDLEDAGLREFKGSWGGEELPLTYSTLADVAPAARGGARALGPVLRRSPAWVGRAVGELLYKYAA
jgi:CelD/BcsL family acetyltransferase involved in cellulose biosynthesis